MENLDILTGKCKQIMILAKQGILEIRSADFLLILEGYIAGVKVIFDSTKKYVILTVAVYIFYILYILYIFYIFYILSCIHCTAD